MKIQETKKEKEKIDVAEAGNMPEARCPVIREIARRAAENFEVLSELAFPNEEDILITETIRSLYLKGCYKEIITLLDIVFRLNEEESMSAGISLIYSCDDNGTQTFAEAFIDASRGDEFEYLKMVSFGMPS